MTATSVAFPVRMSHDGFLKDKESWRSTARREVAILVHEVMSAGLVTVKKTDTVRSVVKKMINRHCATIPVVEEDNQLIGLVTLRDVLLPLYPNHGDYIHNNVHAGILSRWKRGILMFSAKK